MPKAAVAAHQGMLHLADQAFREHLWMGVMNVEEFNKFQSTRPREARPRNGNKLSYLPRIDQICEAADNLFEFR